MTIASQCFSILQAPRCRLNSLAYSLGGFPGLTRNCKKYSGFKLFGSSSSHDGGNSRRWTKKPITTETVWTKKNTLAKKPAQISFKILDERVSNRTAIKIDEVDSNEIERLQYAEVREEIVANVDLANLVTVIVFDIETTGFSRENERIIEIALQDLQGGENSTFQTLINPERTVENSHVHGITNHMVNRHDVPRMKDLIPILLQYVRSREKPNGEVLFIAHNGRAFDLPFMINEFRRCSFDIPSNWHILDTIDLSRELMNLEGSSIPSKSSLKLQSLRELFGVPLDSKAHRAMSDVKVLSLVFQRLTFELKLPLPAVMERSTPFKILDSKTIKKKKGEKGNFKVAASNG